MDEKQFREYCSHKDLYIHNLDVDYSLKQVKLILELSNERGLHNKTNSSASFMHIEFSGVVSISYVFYDERKELGSAIEYVLSAGLKKFKIFSNCGLIDIDAKQITLHAITSK